MASHSLMETNRGNALSLYKVRLFFKNMLLYAVVEEGGPMKTRHLPRIAILLFLTFQSLGKAQEKAITTADIPTRFQGSFVWMAEPGEHGDFDYVTLQIDKLQEK